ncbi:MAG: hypothetical protein JSS87_12835 [Acidobacteria bacterium]|nr:hypothetical protein [Acidobacteriota bacterium]
MDWGDFLGGLGQNALDFTSALTQAGSGAVISDITGQPYYYAAPVYGSGNAQVVNRNSSMTMVLLIIGAVILLRK